MTPEQNRNGFSVEIKELKEDGISDEPIEFVSYSELDKFVHRQNGYVYKVVKTSKQGKRKRKYIISSPTFQYGGEVNGTYYIITKINHKQVTDMSDVKAFYLSHHKQVTDMSDVKAFYLSHPSYQDGYMKDKTPQKKSKEQLMLEKQRRRHLLLTIDVKYGGLDKAEGSPELEELRDMIGATEDGRKKHEI